ncbi:MAG: methylmalonyl-CoA mutase family protein, partial [Candidatus Bathyarchaeia archaeon]
LPIRTLKIDENAQRSQVERLRRLREKRDRVKVHEALEKLRAAFQNPNANCIPPMLEAVKAYATLGEITRTGREVFGEWREPSIL